MESRRNVSKNLPHRSQFIQTFTLSSLFVTPSKRKQLSKQVNLYKLIVTNKLYSCSSSVVPRIFTVFLRLDFTTPARKRKIVFLFCLLVSHLCRQHSCISLYQKRGLCKSQFFPIKLSSNGRSKVTR